LSVDWDFFFLDLPKYDFGHGEKRFLVNDIWQIRLMGNPQLFREYVPEGHHEFWAALRGLGLQPKELIVSDSHSDAYPFLIKTEIEWILHFDSHSDMYERDLGEVTAENWLLHLMEKKSETSTIWVRPKEYKEATTRKSKVFSRVAVVEMDRLEKSLRDHGVVSPEVEVSFVSRSGGWTPPWADYVFLTFLENSKAQAVIYKSDIIRPRKYDLKAAKKAYREARRTVWRRG